MSYEFFSELPEVQETVEQKPLIRNLEHGVTLEQHELGQADLEQGEDSECIGNPERDMENWHRQAEPNSCAIACQEFVAEQLLDRDFSEKEMIRFAREQGWYRPESGTPQSYMGDILESLGLEVERETGQTLSDLAEDLQQRRKVICSVNSMILSNSDFAELPGMKADHAVEVIGIDVSNPENVQVILNDSDAVDGRGRRISADTFMKAWATSRNFAVTAWKED